MDRTGCFFIFNKRLDWGRKRTAKGAADLAVARRPFGASRRSRTNLQSWCACCLMRRVGRLLLLALPFAARRFGAPRVLHCCCSSPAVVARAVGAAVVGSVVGACLAVRGAG